MLKRIFILIVCVFVIIPLVAYGQELPDRLESPSELVVLQEYHENGSPYFVLKCSTPGNVAPFLNNDGYIVWYEVDYKPYSKKWKVECSDAGLPCGISGITDQLTQIVFDPVNDASLEGVDIKTSGLSFRVRFVCCSWMDNGEPEYSYSGFSNSASFNTRLTTANYYNYSDWAYNELEKAESYGIITNSIRDKMNAPITREEFAELAVRLVEVYTGKTPTAAPKETFNDTTNEQVLKAYSCGIVNGVGGGRFEPKALASREQIATMIARTMQLISPDMDTTYTNETIFFDESQVAEYFLPYVKFMSQKGFIKGSEGKFHPKDNCTREQAVLIVVRVYESISGITDKESGVI